MAHHGPRATQRDARDDHRTAAYCPLTAAAGRGRRHDAAARQRLAGAALAAAGEA